MTEDTVLALSRDALVVMGMVSAPVLVTTLVIGLLISVFQALTQINEATLTFIPKMVIAAIVLMLAGPWMLDLLQNYTVNLFESIATIVRE